MVYTHVFGMANSTLFGTVKILVGPKFGTKSGVWEAFLGPNEVCKPTPEMHTFFGGPNRGVWEAFLGPNEVCTFFGDY